MRVAGFKKNIKFISFKSLDHFKSVVDDCIKRKIIHRLVFIDYSDKNNIWSNNNTVFFNIEKKDHLSTTDFSLSYSILGHDTDGDLRQREFEYNFNSEKDIDGNFFYTFSNMFLNKETFETSEEDFSKMFVDNFLKNYKSGNIK